jgi:3',5'-cyclic AMP phosphodiesterase CpdA
MNETANPTEPSAGQPAVADGHGDALSFVHFTDPHLTSPAGAGAVALANKRVLGYLSWRRRRRFIHQREVLAALVADVQARSPGQIAVTGDLTQVGLPAECEDALAWLSSLAPPERVSLVPGNHDRYVAADWSRTIGRWHAFMASDDDSVRIANCTGGRHGFPTLRVRGPVAFIGLSSACASPPLMATGRLGRRQRVAFAELLTETAARGLFRVVLIHHPPVPGSYKWRKRLTDGGELVEVLSEHGAGLVLHGHTHRLMVNSVTGPDGQAIPVVGLSSASAAGSAPERHARYSLWTVQRHRGAHTLSHAARVYEPSSGAFADDDWDPLSAI